VPAKKSARAESVDGYLVALPEVMRAALERLRKIIKAAAPGTGEVVSYRVPIFKLQGHPLVGFGAAGNRCSFYVMSSNMIPKLALARADELRGTMSEVLPYTFRLTNRFRPRL